MDDEIIDAKNADPLTTVAGLNNAVAKKVDGIFTYYIDCKYLVEPLEAAKAAGIPVVNSNGKDCNESDPGAESLFTATVSYASGTFTDWVNEMILAQLRYPVVKFDGKAQMALAIDSTSESGEPVVKYVSDEVAKCTECSLEVLEVPVSDLGTKLQGKAESFLLKNPEVDSLVPAYSAILTSGLMAAVETTPRDLLVSVAEGLPEGLELIREGKAQYGAGISYGWEGYAAMDTLNRVMQGEEPVSSGMGVKLFDEEHNFPEGDVWEPPYDYKTLYMKAWGLEG